MTFWETVFAHTLAVLFGGLKVMIIGWVFWYIIRKRFLKKILGSLMKDIGEALGIPLGIPPAVPVAPPTSVHEGVAPVAAADGDYPPSCAVPVYPKMPLPASIIQRSSVCAMCHGWGRDVQPRSETETAINWCSSCSGAGYIP